MANVKFSAIVADARGKVGGVVFGRGGGGSIVRTNVKPCNPRSSAQSARRAVMAYLTQYWSKTLSNTNRNGWNDYAAGTSWTNKVGTAALISGMSAFVRLNSLIFLARNATTEHPAGNAWPIREVAPLMVGHAGTPSFTITADGGDNHIHLLEPTVPFLKANNDHFMVFFTHGCTNAGRTRPGSNRRYLGYLEGSAGAPPAFPYTMTSPFNFENGQNVYCTGIFLDEKGRVGGDFTASVLAATP